jgi:hypothetical protein
MPSDPGLDGTRRFAAGEVKRILDLPEPTVDRLFARAQKVIGQDHATRCLELARLAPLSHRFVPTSALAALVAGTEALGPEWWVTPHEEIGWDETWTSLGTPEALLASGRSEYGADDANSCLAELARWIADDAADRQWGRPIDRIDPNDPRPDGGVVLPEGAKAGDRFPVAVGYGVRVWVDVVEREGKAPSGAVLLTPRLAEKRFHDVALIRTAWTISVATGPIRLPGETPGRPSDPFADHLDHDSSRRLFTWAVANGASKADLGGPWRTKDQLWTARLRVGLPYSHPGAWFIFDDAVAAAINGDQNAVFNSLAELER